MIKNKLAQDHAIGRLYNSYLIETDKYELALAEIEEFLIESIFKDASQVKSHPDFLLLKREEVASKNITVDQVRNLVSFLSKTSVVSGFKVGVIVGAEYMNLNSANLCLKIFEDTPKNCLLFLITSNAAAILPTIRSRCSRITHLFEKSKEQSLSEAHLRLLDKTTKLEEILAFLKEFTVVKDRQKWLDFAINVEALLAKFIKYSARLPINLTQTEERIYYQLSNHSIPYLTHKSDEVKTLINNTVEFDLDLRASSLLLIDYLKK